MISSRSSWLAAGFGVFLYTTGTPSWSADAAAQVLPSSIRACALERDDARRLSCYDRAIKTSRADETSERENNTKTRAELSQAENSSAENKPASPTAAQFGMEHENARKQRERADAAAPERIEAIVAQATTLRHGAVVITLDNGQVWAQKSVDTRLSLEVGDRIVIKRGAFGSFLLLAPNSRPTRVERQK